MNNTKKSLEEQSQKIQKFNSEQIALHEKNKTEENLSGSVKKMTTKDLIRRLNNLDFVGEIIEEARYIEIFDPSNYRIGYVDKEIMHQMSTIYQGFGVLRKDARKTLFDLLSEYTKTPIKDR